MKAALFALVTCLCLFATLARAAEPETPPPCNDAIACATDLANIITDALPKADTHMAIPPNAPAAAQPATGALKNDDAGAPVAATTDKFGNTVGTAGKDSVNTYTDKFGNTTGAVGNKGVNLHTDNFGNTTGYIGNNNTSLYTDSFGNTTGIVGNKYVSCFTDSFGNTTCVQQ